MDKLTAILKTGRGLGEKALSLIPSKSVVTGFAIAAVSGAALFAIGQRVYITIRTKRVVQKDSDPTHLFVLVPGYLGSPSQMQYFAPPTPPRNFFSPLMALLCSHLITCPDISPLASDSATNASQ
jgi:hypothetical protein